MAKQPRSEQSDTRESRAWELFAHRVMVGGIPSVMPEHLARECFQAVSAFEAVAEQDKTPKG